MRAIDDEPGWAVVRAAATAAREALGVRLVGAYAIGSLAHGGFSAAASDVDLALLTEDLLAPAAVRQITAETGARSASALARRLSIFHAPWSELGAPPPGARFPAIDRLDLVLHGRPLGCERRGLPPGRPSRDEVVREAVCAALETLSSDPVRAALRRPSARDRDLRELAKLVLFPVRLLFVVRTAHVGGNDDAGARYRAGVGASALPLVDRALAWRRLGRIPDPAGAQALLERELLALHLQVLDALLGAPGLPMRPAAVARRNSL